MEFGLAFSFPFKDQEWFKKIALVALVSLIPVVGQLIVLGWGLEIAKRVIEDNHDTLPELDFGGQLGRGFQAFVIGFVYALPVFILMIPIQAVGPIGVALDLSDDILTPLMVIVSICCGGLLFLYSIFLAFMMPAAYGNFVAKGTIGDGLRFAEVFGLVRSAPVAYLLVIAASLAAGFIGSLGSIACVIGVYLTMAYSQAIIGHITGQAYKQATRAQIVAQ